MSYLLDKKEKRKKYLRYTFLAVVLAVLIYFRFSVFYGLSYLSHVVFRPVLILGNNIGEKFSSTAAYFYSKKALFLENENIRSKLEEQSAQMANYDSILDENSKLKEILERKNEKTDMILASILSKPNQSPYDTLVIDTGVNEGIRSGKKVFAFGNIPLGYIAEIYPNSSKIVLFSSPGQKIEAVISGRDVFVELVGRGGGNFEMIMPRDFILEKGTEVVLPGITPYTIAIVQTIISDPRDSFQKVLLLSPVNIFELKFVEVER